MKPSGGHHLDLRVKNQSFRFEPLSGPRVRREDHAQAGVRCHRIQDCGQRAQIHRRVDVFFTVRADDEVALRLEAQARQHVRPCNLVAIVLEDLDHRAAGLDDAVRRKAFAHEILAGDAAVRQVDVRDVIHEPPIDLLGDAVVEAAVPRLHVEDGDAAALRRDGRERAVSVAQDEQRVRLCLGSTRSMRMMTCPMVSAASAAGGLEEVIRTSDSRGRGRRRRSARRRSSGRCEPAHGLWPRRAPRSRARAG